MKNLRFSKITIALLILPLAALFNDALTYRVGSIFVTPYKLALILSATLLFQSFLSFFSKKNKVLSNISVCFISYCLLSCKLKYVNISSFFDSFIKVILIIFFLSMFLSSAQLIFKDQLIYTGLFASRKITYAITGFNIERLFLSEFLILGLAMIMFKNKYSKSIRLILLIWVGFLIVYSGSFTGILGFLALMFIIFKKINFKSSFYYSLILIPFLILSNIDLGESFKSKLSFNDKKFESYFTNASEENWRLISSLALLEDVISNPTFLGNGFLSNALFLKDVNYYYSINKYGKSKVTDKANTSHTFVSVIYDQGIIGFIIIIIFVISVLNLFLKLYRKSKYVFDINYSLILKITLVLSVLVLLRFTFYYHAINHWHYLVLLIFINLLSSQNKNIRSIQ